MTPRQLTCLVGLAAVLLLGLGSGLARAQTSAEEIAVISANQAFYTALSAMNIAAMNKVWAHESYVIYIGPFHKSAIVGWPAVQAELQTTNALASEIAVKPMDIHVRINGDTAWLFGREVGAILRKVGKSATGYNFVTNIFEKKDGLWLMVAHHAQRIPE
jgi:ketosteroid isomerase-like protein